MNKEKVISWIEDLESMADQSDKYFIERNKLFIERNKLFIENKQLKDNWNKLKEYINEVGSPFVDGYGYVQIEDKIVYVDDVLDKMQELENGDSNVEYK